MGDDTGDTQPGVEWARDPRQAAYHADLKELLVKLDREIADARQALALAQKLPPDAAKAEELRKKIADLQIKRDGYDELLVKEGGAVPCPSK